MTTIRPERPEDAARIRALTRAAFAGAHHASGTEPAIVDALRAAGALSLSLVAVEADAVIGHAAFSPVTVGDKACGWYGLGPVSVIPGRQRSGIGSALIREGLAELATRDAAGCVVVGDPGYYGRFGFRSDPRLRYPGVAPVYFQSLAFRPPLPEGEVAFHPGFEAT